MAGQRRDAGGGALSVSVRPATAADARSLPAVERSAGEAFRALPDLAWIADHDVLPERAHRAAISAGTAWVAEIDGWRVGFLTAVASQGVLHVAEMAVSKGYQRRGIGSALMAQAVLYATAAGALAVTLTTFRDVPWNAPYYERLGFAIVEQGACDARLGAILAGESDAGLPRRTRCAMAKVL